MKLSAENAQKLNTRYNGRAISFTQNGRYRGRIDGYLLIVTESGFLYYDSDFCREYFQPWTTFGGFTSISESKSMKHKRYNKGEDGKFSGKMV